jgi:hypothetical protein
MLTQFPNLPEVHVLLLRLLLLLWPLGNSWPHVLQVLIPTVTVTVGRPLLLLLLVCVWPDACCA